MPNTDYLEIVKHLEGWALRRGFGGPSLLSGGDQEAIIAAGRRIALAFGLPLLVNGRGVGSPAATPTMSHRRRRASSSEPDLPVRLLA